MHLRCWTCLSIRLTFTTTTLHRTQKHDHKNLHINHPSLHPKGKTDMYQHIHIRTLTMQHKLIQTSTYQVRTARTCTQRHAHVHAMIKMWVRKRESGTWAGLFLSNDGDDTHSKDRQFLYAPYTSNHPYACMSHQSQRESSTSSQLPTQRFTDINIRNNMK